MKFLADLHIHSPFSRATSKESNLTGLFAWARVKGIHLIGTGDFTHPGWFQHLKENLIPAEPGFYRLRNENVPPAFNQVAPEAIDVRFVLTAEISSIYKRHDRVRKVHNILFAPDFAAVEKMNRRLAAIGNIESDGRPILGLDSRNLLEIALEEMPGGFLVPAHIWTPWFSLFGSKSGFDSIEECFGDLSDHIFALETGLSSDPDMNRLVSALDRFTLISNSDCHSPGKLGRELNRFDCDFDFFTMREALKDPGKGFAGTMEFFPEEGKYHLDGHRKCNVSMEPRETKKHRGICPVCGKPLTIGVSHRVLDLADRDAPVYPANGPSFKSLIPLPEVIGEIMGKGPATKGVLEMYQKTINRFGSEFNIFLHTPVEEICRFSPLLAEAVDRIRTNRVIRQGGFDGEFGVIHTFAEGEINRLRGQASLFTDTPPAKRKKREVKNAPPADILPLFPPLPPAENTTRSHNPEQQTAIDSTANRILVSAGPGTGKTHTLVSRLVHLLQVENAVAARIFAITFTNRAANEMKERLMSRAGGQADQVFVGTFHRFCLEWLRQDTSELTVIGEEDRAMLLKKLFPAKPAKEKKKLSSSITDFFLGAEADNQDNQEEIDHYLDELEQLKAVDLEAVIPVFVQRLKTDEDFSRRVRVRVAYLFVDEFQDVNRSQYELVTLLAGSAKIFAIGDPNQAIYGFRGSDLHFFLQFAADADTHCLSLSRNYRSGAAILEAATAVIEHNQVKGDTRLAAQNREIGDITLFPAASGKAEAENVVKQIEKILGGISSFSINSGRSQGDDAGFSFRDIGVLYRLGRQAGDLAEALSRRGIPFQMIGVRPFFMEKELRGLYFWTLAAADRATFSDSLNLCREVPGIGPTSVALLENRIAQTSRNFFSDALALPLPVKASLAIQSVIEHIHRFQQDAQTDLPRAFLPVFNLLGADPHSAPARRFIELAGAFGSLVSFALHLAENARATIYDDRAEAVSLMTLHGAKGLEFPVVFITGLEEGLLPCRSMDCDIEEERRLFFVGMTRAKAKLILSYVRQNNPSPFLSEIPTHLLQTMDIEGAKRRKSTAKQLKLF
ncbi:MAG: UvrD-helicase domain-containing protein [Proteobacteria bacterium]|nr:UvrD-helicase domain-containing protein [Pseudomonadota bacterium]MBU4296907.1 UvrD-helicase domain-containing protein [Pseudomonadota bacterium]MCG2749285.1 UvrD-helicase domain-containing protein [Desulfobulbaceae bacterium]